MRFFKLISFLISCFFSVNAVAQKQLDSIYSVHEMVEDFNYLHQHLRLNHPGIYRYTNKESWDSIYQNTLSKLTNPLRDVQYRLVLRQYLENIKCGHTQVIPSRKSIKLFEKRKHYAAPFKVAFVNNKIFVTTNETNDSSLEIGTEILSVNKHLAQEIIAKIYAIQNADAGLNTMKNYYGALQFQTYFMALFGEDSVYDLSCIKPNGDTQTYVVKEKKLVASKTKTPKEKYTLFHQRMAEFRITKGDTQAAILKIRGFQINKASKLFARAFEEMTNQEIKYLIVDLRGNGGGSIEQAAELLTYISKDSFSYGFASGTQGLTYHKHAKQKIMYYFSRLLLAVFGNKTEGNNQYHYLFEYDKKSLKRKTHFKGAVFCIIDNGSFSAASFVAAYAKYKANAIIIGQETAGTESGCYAVNTPLLELPNTKNYIRIPHYQFKHILPINDSEKGVLPTIETPENAQTINLKNDTEMDLIWKIILDNQK